MKTQKIVLPIIIIRGVIALIYFPDAAIQTDWMKGNQTN